MIVKTQARLGDSASFSSRLSVKFTSPISDQSKTKITCLAVIVCGSLTGPSLKISSRLWLTSLTPPSPMFSTVDSIFSRSSVKAPEIGLAPPTLPGLPRRKVADEGGPDAAAACG